MKAIYLVLLLSAAYFGTASAQAASMRCADPNHPPHIVAHVMLACADPNHPPHLA